MPTLKFALCVPAYGDVKGKFFQSFADMLTHTLSAHLRNEKGEEYELDIETFVVSSSILCESRHRLVAEALAWEADYLLWMDSDHVFPRNALCRLWARNLPIVGANYARRCKPTAPTAARIVTDDDDKDHKNLVYTTQKKAKANEVEEVSHLGFGLVLMRAGVFNLLQVYAESQGLSSFLPLFAMPPKEDGMSFIGEDVYFFKKVREAGISVHCDHALSWEVGHIHDRIITNAHACVEEKAWVEQGKKIVKRFEDKATELEAAE
jgi:hypothetical protein